MRKYAKLFHEVCAMIERKKYLEKLISKKDKSIRYLRVFAIYDFGKEVKAKCYLTTKGGEIGVWDDKIELLYNIKDNYDLEDCGEWNV